MSRSEEEHTLQFLGGVVHGLLVPFHLLGVAYNAKRGNWRDTTIHTIAVLYDGWAMYEHVKCLDEVKPVDRKRNKQ